MANAALIAGAIATGLVAGVFAIYGNTIMPGLRATDDRTFVAAFQAIDRAIINPVFLSVFFGALVLAGTAAILHRSLLIGGAAVLYLGAVWITIAINVPMNDALKAAGDPDRIDVAAVRQSFDERRWVRWNVVRTIASLLAFGGLVWAAAAQ